MRYEAAYQSTYMTCLLKVIEESCFEFPMAMVIGFVWLQDLVKPFIKEHPKVMKWAIVSHTFANVAQVMMIWLDDMGAVELSDVSLSVSINWMIWGSMVISLVQYSQSIWSAWSISASVNWWCSKMRIVVHSFRKFFGSSVWSRNLSWEMPSSVGSPSFAIVVRQATSGTDTPLHNPKP